VRNRLFIALTVAVATASSFVAAGTAASPIHLVEAGGPVFPQRSWILSLPAGQRLLPASVKLTENGHGTVGLKVVPSGTGASKIQSGTILAIDASKSMSGAPIEGAMAAAKAFAARRNVNQRLGVVTFNSRTHVILSFTRSQSAVDQALANQPPLAYQTHLYDAVAQSVALLQTAGIGAGSVIVLSDGADVHSLVSLEQVIQTAKSAHMRVFTVGLKSKTFRPAPLQQLAAETGGTFSRADSPEDLAQIYDKLGLQLAQEYILSYNSVVKPGLPVKVDVSVAGLGATSAGYVTPTLPGPNAVFHQSLSEKVWRSWLTMIVFALLIPGLVGAAVLVPLRARQGTVRARISDYVSMPGRQHEDALVSRVFSGTEKSLERSRWWGRFKDALQFADISIPPVQIVFGTVILTVFAMWVFSRIDPILFLFGLAVPLVVRGLIMARMSRKRRLFGDQLPDNLDVLASGLRAGHSLVGAFAVVVNDAPEPSKSEFQRVIADEQLGIPLEAALSTVAKRMKSRDVEQIALVASVQGETGGNAAEVLDRVVESIRERQELRRLVRTLTAQGRVARWIVTLLPVGLLLFISSANRDYVKPLFVHSSGRIMLALAAARVVMGSVVIGKIVDIKV
jgi:tight adherence protein B